MEESSDNSRTELDSHDRIVILGPNCYVFESTRRTCNSQQFTSDLGIAKNVLVLTEPYHVTSLAQVKSLL